MKRKVDWLDYRVFYVLDSIYGENIEHTFWQDVNPINCFALPLWYLREIWRGLRGKENVLQMLSHNSHQPQEDHPSGE